MGDDEQAPDQENYEALLGDLAPGVLASVHGIEDSSAFRWVVTEYLSGNPPPIFESAIQQGAGVTGAAHRDAIVNGFLSGKPPPSCHPTQRFSAKSATHALLLKLGELRARIEANNHDIVGVEWDKQWSAIQSEWTEKRSKLAGLLREVADLYESGQCDNDPDPHPHFDRYKEQDEKAGIVSVDEIIWCGAYNFRRWADLVERSPVEVVFPRSRPQPSGWSVHNIGQRGDADPDAALRASVLRAIAEYVPLTMLRNGGYRAIADLASFVGIQFPNDNTRRQYVASILKQSST